MGKGSDVALLKTHVQVKVAQDKGAHAVIIVDREAFE